MPTLAKGAIHAVVAVAIGAIVLAGCTPPTSPGPGGVARPSTQPSSAPSAAPESAAPAALTTDFTSPVNGYSITYPGGWKVTSATKTWASGSTVGNSDDGTSDSFNGQNMAIYVSSQKLAADTTPAAWTKKFLDDADLNYSRFPECAVAKSEPVVIDGVAGVLDVTCPSINFDAIVTSGGRAYDLALAGDPPDKAWFLEVLKTVKLHPDKAVDSPPSAEPSAGPSTSP